MCSPFLALRRTLLASFLAAFSVGVAIPSPALGQAPHASFRHLAQQDGLSMNVVQTVWQDRTGFVWIGTQDGLNRWDGETLEIFGSEGRSERSLSSSFVQCLAEDAEGHLWVGTNSFGLDRYDPETGLFDRYRHDPGNAGSLVSNEIESLLVDRRNRLLVGTALGIDLLDPSTDQITHFRPDPEVEPFLAEGVLALHQDREGRLWAGTRGGLLRLDADAGTYRYALAGSFPADEHTVAADDGTDEPALAVTRSGSIRDITDHPEGGLWLVAGKALLHYRPDKGIESRFQHRPGDPHSLGWRELRSVLVDADGRTWVAGQDGLFLYRPGDTPGSQAGARFQRFAEDPNDPTSLADDNVATLYLDRSGWVWIGTVSGGVDRFDPRTWDFGHYKGSTGAEHGLEESNVFAFSEGPDGDAWIGTLGGGLYHWRRNEQHFVAHRHDPAVATSIASDGVTSLVHDRRNRLWIGTYDAGLQLMEDPSTGTFRRFPSDPESTSGTSSEKITSLLESRQGDLWIGTFGGGLDRLPADGDRFEHFRADPDDPTALPEDRVTCLEEDGSGRLWIGTNNGGLAYFDEPRNRFVTFRHDAEDHSSLPSDDVLTLHADLVGRLWIGTQGKGLALLRSIGDGEGRGAVLRTWTNADGLVNETIYAIGSDGSGHIWLSTNEGLIRFDPASEELTNFAPRHGLQGAEFNLGAYYRSPSGELFFGGTNGFNAFYPDRIRIAGHPPGIVLTDLGVRGGEWRAPAIEPAHLRSLELDHRNTAITFDLAVLDFAAPAENRYAYRLDPFDPDWVESPVDRQAVYTNLGAGHYTFRAKGANADGVWSDRELRIEISVAPAPWETWWAYTAYLALIVGLGYTGYKRRIEGLRRRGAELAELVAQRTRELSETVERLKESETAAHGARRRALKALEEALAERRRAQQADRAKSSFLSSMSHELRTPLNAMLGFAQLLERDEALSRDHQESLGVILRSGEHLLGLINDVLSLSKIEAGRLGLNLGPFDLRRSTTTLMEMVRVRAEQAGLELRFSLDPRIPETLIGDSGRLTQILLNLLGNAIKFTDEGHVELAIEKVDGRIRFAVSDTGPGIPEAERAELFEPFAQTEIGRRSREGTGLGLAISHELVAIMGGELTAESTVGEGTTFAFDLELEEASAEQPALVRRRVVGLEPGQEPARILVVDDVPENRDLLVRLHEAVGLEVQTAANGREALEVWGHWRPQLIWMDMRMPVMDGYEATRRIRQAEAELAGRRTLIIAFTATAFEHDHQRILSTGCDDVLTKPYRDEALFTKLGEHLGLRFTYDEILAEDSSTTIPRPEIGPGSSEVGPSPVEDTDAASPDAASPDAASPAHGSASTVTPRSLGQRRILIAEDSPANQMVAQRMLTRLGCHTEVVSNGIQALAAAEDRGPFDLIFMDIRMPEMDGLEATRALRRALPPGRQPVIIALTGLASESERQDCLDAGMDDVLPKPFRLVDLEATVRRWLPGDGSAAARRGAPDTRATVALRRPGLDPRFVRRSDADEPEIDDLRPEQAINLTKLEQLERLEEGDRDHSLTAQVISLFLDTVPGQLEDLRAAVAARDRHRWRKVAHSLKNSSATLGADAVSEVCRELEELGRRTNPTPDVYARADQVSSRLAGEVRRALRALEILRRR